jgi:putative DNA primase/helicase
MKRYGDDIVESFYKTCDDDREAPLDDTTIATLAGMPPLAYHQQRRDAAKMLGITVGVLDKLVRSAKAQAQQAESALPHWNVEPWTEQVSGAMLLTDIVKTFERYIVLPKGAADTIALWTLHAWTINAGDTSPFLVFVSPTKRCGKTSALIVLYYLTPRSELASNISASALFRYVEEIRPTLLIDEADSFVKDNEEMRGILNSGHTKTAAHVIRNVEFNGEHKPKRFSTWAPKAIATIRALADTLEDRAVVVQLQRKPKAAGVVRLRKRDSDEFASLRRQAARWADDNFSRLTDPEPGIPEVLNDRAADNWRPLFAIADLAGGTWPQAAREAACLLSGEGHDSTSINVELLADIQFAFGETDVIRSADLVAKLTADPERPWAEWRHGKPLTRKQLGGLLRPFGIISETVSIPGLADAKGYKRARFEEAWAAYCPGQNHLHPNFDFPKRRNVGMPMALGESSDFRNVAESNGDGSKNANLSYSRSGFDISTFRKPESGAPSDSDQRIGHSPTTSSAPVSDLWEGLDIPDSLKRTPPRLGPPAISSGPDDDLGDLQ